MSDVNIFKKKGADQERYLLVPETDVGLKYLKETFVSTGKLFEIRVDPTGLQEVIDKMFQADLTVEVY